ncbi:MAG: hypothetical protein RMM53_00420 [Bacteroidia bacterium]|nr:hypothetical protein [Bacteroidia bacterium]
MPKLIFWILLLIVATVVIAGKFFSADQTTLNPPAIPGQKTSTTPNAKAHQIRTQKFQEIKKKLDKLPPWIPMNVAGKYHYFLGMQAEYLIVDLPDISDIAEGEERFFYYWKTGGDGNIHGTVKRTGKKLHFSDLGEAYLTMDKGIQYLVFEDKILKKQPR